MLSYSRDKLIIDDISIKMPNNKIIYYYEIINIKVEDLREDIISICLYTRDNTELRIQYDNGESLEKVEKELNYLIESVLED